MRLHSAVPMLVCGLLACGGSQTVPDGGTSPDGSGAADGAAGAGGQGGGGAGGTGGAAGTGGPCATDADCAFHSEAGCCGMCLAKTDAVPPTIPCGANCGTPPSCLCIDGRCREGTLTPGAGCDLSRSQCGRNLMCCRLCSPVGAGCGSPTCETPITYSGLPVCPQPS
jgi:hypothetical protein